MPHVGHAYVVGLTGAPGVGKSTMTAALVASYRGRGCRVGVLAVDPSSPFSGGALLGDRVRMQDHATDDGVYIRSMASRGHLGGLSWSTPQALRVLDAAGCDIVLHCNGRLEEMQLVASEALGLTGEAGRRAAAALALRRNPDSLDADAARASFADAIAEHYADRVGR